MTQKNKPQDQLEKNLKYLKLPYMRDQHQSIAKRASQKKWSHLDYFEKLADGEAALRRDHSVQRRIRLARFPVIKTLDEFNWTWPKDINRLQVQNIFPGRIGELPSRSPHRTVRARLTHTVPQVMVSLRKLVHNTRARQRITVQQSDKASPGHLLVSRPAVQPLGPRSFYLLVI